MSYSFLANPGPGIFGSFESSYGAMQNIRNQRLRSQMLQHQQALVAQEEPARMALLNARLAAAQLSARPHPKREAAHLAQYQAMAKLAQERAQAFPQVTQSQEQIRQAQLARLQQPAAPRVGGMQAVTRTGLPISSIPSGIPVGGEQPIAPQAPSQPPGAPSLAAVAPDQFIPSPIGASRSKASLFVNPRTGETLSALTPATRTLLQKQQIAIHRMLPVIEQLKKAGAVGTLGAPSLIGQQAESVFGLGGDPLAAASYGPLLKSLSELYPAAAGISSTDPTQKRATDIFERQHGEDTQTYITRLNRDVHHLSRRAQHGAHILSMNAIPSSFNAVEPDMLAHNQETSPQGNPLSKMSTQQLLALLKKEKG